MRDLLGIGLRFADQRLQPCLQVLSGCAVEAAVDLAGIDQLLALEPTDINAVKFVFLQRKASYVRRLPLGAGLFDPIIAPARRIPAIADLGDHAFEAGLAGVLIYYEAVDLETFAELDISSIDKLPDYDFLVESRLEFGIIWPMSKFLPERISRDEFRSLLELGVIPTEKSGDPESS